ncbi:uncharacterized protein LOC109718621 [Ananas comosus]|uniref:Uncharacterized protein LOC109718621 n=1 Tax=Ananas comosus TaxID=4615 RepID=A0A6P5FWZ6_ANACO|nr:uncharacterized protein LOC109718621 [Ananas comosus]
MHLVASTKSLIQKLRDEGWDSLFEKVKLFCAKHDIEVPIMSAPYVGRGGRARLQRDHITLEHHYRVDIFNGAIDCQLQELNTRFSDNMIELLTLSCALDPKDGCKSFNIDDICNLAKRYYPQDFTEFEREGLRIELRHYEFEISRHFDLQKLATISELCQWLVTTRKSEIYPLLYRLVKLVLILPVSTATTERAFSAMNIIKTDLRNKMDDDFLTNSLIVYIEREIAEKFTVDSIIDGFRDLKERRALF